MNKVVAVVVPEGSQTFDLKIASMTLYSTTLPNMYHLATSMVFALIS